MTVYEKIDRVLKQHENYKYCERSLDSIADYIDWAWKWRKITEAEKDEFVIVFVRFWKGINIYEKVFIPTAVY